MSSLEPDSSRPVELNPYKAPETVIGAEPLLGEFDIAEAEATRKLHLNHEASVKAIGALNYLGAVILIGAALFFLAIASGMVPAGPMAALAQQEGGRAVMAGMGVFFLAFGVLGGFVGNGLRRLRPWARWTETVLMSIQTVLNLIRINPFGLLISIYILYLMLSRKGAVVFSPEYQDVIARTPHIRYKTSLVVKIALVALLLVLGLLVVGAVISMLMNRR